MPFQSFGSRLSLCLIASVMPCPLMFSIAGTANGNRLRAEPERDRDRHRRQHVGGVVFLVDGLVADHGPARGLDDFDVEPVLLVEAERRGHDDRRGAGDRDEADLEVLLLAARLRQRLRSPSSAGRIATAPRARWRHRPISERRAARHLSERPPASRRRRPRPRSACPRSGPGPPRNAAFARHDRARRRSDAGRRRSRFSAAARHRRDRRMWTLLAPLCRTGRPAVPAAPQICTARPLFVRSGGTEHARSMPLCLLRGHRSASPSSIGSDGSRDHSFQEPKYIRTSFTPAFFSARKVFEARAPLKQ